MSWEKQTYIVIITVTLAWHVATR